MDESRTSRTIIAIVLSGVLVWFIYLIRGILPPFILSAILAYVLAPLVNRFRSTGMRRIFAVLLVYLILLILLWIVMVVIVPPVILQARSLQQNLPQYLGAIQQFSGRLQEETLSRIPVFQDRLLVENVIGSVQRFVTGIVTQLPGYLIGLFSLVFVIFLVIVLTFLMLLNGGRMIQNFYGLVPGRHIETTLSIIWEIDAVLGRFIRSQIVEAAAVGVLSMTGFFIIGIDYALLIGLFSGVANLVPYIGPVAGGTLAAVIGLIQYQQFSVVLRVIIVVLAVQSIDNYIIQPVVMSRGVKLNPLTIIFAVLAGAELYGLIGMLLAVPVAGMIKGITLILMKRRYA